MSTEPFIGEIKLFGFYFAPRGYMTCNGQLLAISSNTALFSLLGTAYGGNGQTTFGLPNLGGRAALGAGQSPGTSNYQIGEAAGSETVTLTTAQMPMHVHSAIGITATLPVGGAADSSDPNGAYPATTLSDNYVSVPTGGSAMGPISVSGTTSVAGGSQPFSIQQPYLVLNYSIAVQGIFPSRD